MIWMKLSNVNYVMVRILRKPATSSFCISNRTSYEESIADDRAAKFEQHPHVTSLSRKISGVSTAEFKMNTKSISARYRSMSGLTDMMAMMLKQHEGDFCLMYRSLRNASNGV